MLFHVYVYLRHGSLLRRAGLGRKPLGSDVGEELSVRLEVVEDALVIEGSDLNLLASISPRDRSSHTFTMRLPGNAPPSRHMVEPQSPLDELAPYTTAVYHNTYQKLEMISLPESATFLCCLGVPLVTLKPSSEKMPLLENALPPILRQSVQWQRI